MLAHLIRILSYFAHYRHDHRKTLTNRAFMENFRMEEISAESRIYGGNQISQKECVLTRPGKRYCD